MIVTITEENLPEGWFRIYVPGIFLFNGVRFFDYFYIFFLCLYSVRDSQRTS